ncbi:hypothetical protein CMUST_15895 (plasmid) [Corynebacterium mustelae]|uniref:Uncharacterized protein n=1 Tax=Corynebacterium mustelae TaxID=571915 RepID=A0A0G3H8H0_9CORY|nr:hypothetical protein CMUST_04325 [Corynebacterium mustelae]AKK07467.1 hypothetical protein CMUST_15895 [Corynebacterium mustelae]
MEPLTAFIVLCTLVNVLLLTVIIRLRKHAKKHLAQLMPERQR